MIMKDWMINAIGVVATCGGYKIAKTVLREVYEDAGLITRTGLNVICGYAGLMIASGIVKKAVAIKKGLDKISAETGKDEENGGN